LDTIGEQERPTVWVFNGGKSFPSGVFTCLALAEDWIARNRLTGTLTEYPLDVGIYDWIVGKDWFKPKRDDQKTPEFIARFSSAYQEHFHYQDGVVEG
jgi:hypothetical protein